MEKLTGKGTEVPTTESRSDPLSAIEEKLPSGSIVWHLPTVFTPLPTEISEELLKRLNDLDDLLARNREDGFINLSRLKPKP